MMCETGDKTGITDIRASSVSAMIFILKFTVKPFAMPITPTAASGLV